MRTKYFLLIVFVLLPFLFAQSALAQTETPGLTLRLNRDFGYASGTGRIQGLFSVRADGREDLVRVAFMIDGQIILDDTEAPFAVQFSTDNYPLGRHAVSATGYTQDGAAIPSNILEREFVSAEESWQSGLSIAGPIFGLVAVVMVLAIGLPLLLDRGKKNLPFGAARQYGISGGTVCPKCSRPFSIHFFAFNVSFAGKFDRCPYCGKWSMVRRLALAELRAAEAAELEWGREALPNTPAVEAEQMKKDLDNTRFSE